MQTLLATVPFTKRPDETREQFLVYVDNTTQYLLPLDFQIALE